VVHLINRGPGSLHVVKELKISVQVVKISVEDYARSHRSSCGSSLDACVFYVASLDVPCVENQRGKSTVNVPSVLNHCLGTVPVTNVNLQE